MKALAVPLRLRLLLLALTVVVPALVVILVDQSEARRRSRDDALDKMVRFAHQMADRQTTAFLAGSELVLSLSQSPGIIESDPAECSRFLSNIARNRNYVKVWKAGPDGTPECAGGSREAVDVARTPLEVLRTGQARTVLDVRVNPATGQPDAILAYPLLRPSGAFEGFIAVMFGLEPLKTTSSGWQAPPGVTLTLADRNGQVLLRDPRPSGDSGGQMGTWLSPPRLAGGAREQVIETPGVLGVRHLHVLVPVDDSLNSGLYLSIGAPPAAMFAASDELLHRQLWLLALLTLIAIGIAWVGGELFVHRPVETLKEATRQIASGTFNSRAQLTVGVPGLGDLSDAFNAMAGALEARQRERDRAETELQASEYRYRFLFEELPHPMWVHDTATLEFLEVNQAALAHFGYSRRELLGMRVDDIRPAGDAPRAASGSRLEAGSGVDQPSRLQKKSGEVIDVEITSHPLIFDGRAGDLVIAQDVTRRRRAEDALRETEERLRFALSAARVGAWEMDLRSGFVYWSETCEAMHGLESGTFAGHVDAFMACVHPEHRHQIKDTVAQARRDRRKTEFEYRTLWPDGRERWIRATADFVYDDDQVPVRAAGVTVDVTDQRSLEDQFRHSQKMEAIGMLAGGVAHDFNNVLVAILGNAEFVRDDLPFGDPHRDDLEEVIKAARRAATLTQQLLTFSRKQVVAPQVLHLGDIVRDMTPMLRRLLGETIDLKAVIGNSGRVKADSGHVEQVLVNLVVNARDAMGAGGRLTIETADVTLDESYASEHPAVTPGAYVMIAVTDTGHGMDAETRVRLFEPFFTTKPKGQGTGLGLATVYGIVQESGGHIWVYSEVGKGTTFKIYLPRTAEVAVTDGACRAAPAAGGVETILVVEDEDAVRNFVGRVLTRKGYTVHAMPSPAEAIEFGRRHRGPIDLILTDVVMPGASGPSVAASLAELHPEARVLYMSGYTDDTVIHHGVQAAELSFLQKPFSAGALLHKLREVLATRPRPDLTAA